MTNTKELENIIETIRNMRSLSVIVILFAFFSCKNNDKNGMIVPRWEKGDFRYVKTTMTSFSRVNQDTIFSISSGNLYKMTINDKTQDSYLLEIVNLSKPDFTFKTSVDSINIKNNVNNFTSLMQSFPKISIPYKVKISLEGEIVEIVEWENVLNTFMIRMIEIADSIGFKPEEHSYIKQYINSNYSVEENLRNTLFKEISDNFELYNIPIPKDSIVVKEIQAPNPQTGQIIYLKVKYRTISIKNGIYEIEMKIDFGDELFTNSQDYVDEYFNEEKKKNTIKPKLDNYSIFYWNSNTSWIDSSKFFVNYQTDTIQVNMKTKTVMYK